MNSRAFLLTPTRPSMEPASHGFLQERNPRQTDRCSGTNGCPGSASRLGSALKPGLPDRADTLFEYAGRVLETQRIMRHLAAYEQECEARLQARGVVTEAKLRLQKCFGLPEDEAYLTLREYSRRTRTALSTVAREILEGRLELPGLRSRLTA